MKDIKITNGQLVINATTGDFDVVESTNQEIEHILRSNKGVWKQSPLVGVGLFNYLNGSFTAEQIKKAIQIQMNYDGISTDEITIIDGELEILGTRNEQL